MNCEQNSYKIMVIMVTGVDLSYGSWHYPSFLLNRIRKTHRYTFPLSSFPNPLTLFIFITVDII